MEEWTKNNDEVHSSRTFFFSNGMLSNYRKVYKNYRDELLIVLWFLNISAVGHNIAHTTYFLK